MPEATSFIDWRSAKLPWARLGEASGTNIVDKRPYYHKQITDPDEGPKILIISAVERNGELRETDYMLLNRQSYYQLMGIGHAAFG